MKKRVDVEWLGRFVAAVESATAGASVSDERIRQNIAAAAAVASPAPGRRRRLAVLAIASFGAASVGLIALKPFGLGHRSVSFTLGDPPVPGKVADLVSVPEDADRPVVIRFSEGSTVALHPSARGRVARTGPAGAEVVVEAGHARFEVVHRSRTDWLVRTGPVAVRVTGTKFDTDYEPRADRFTFSLDEGSVVLSGCGFGEGKVLQAPQRLQRSCSEGSRAPRAVSSPGTAGAPGTSPPPASRVDGEVELRPGARSSRAGSSSTSWIKLAQGGRYAEAYEMAQADFERICRSSKADEVWMLADVSRLAGHAAEAERAYAALRARHPRAALSADAAFALGRLAADIDHDRPAAERWFETYLHERPGGRLARAALGRLLELRLAAGDQQGARAAALEYRQRYPDGPRAGEADALVNSEWGVSPGLAPAPRQDDR